MTDSSERRAKRLAKKLSFSQLAEDTTGATLRGVVLLAEGEWHDSLTPYPTIYTPQNLAAFTVKDNAGWRTHEFSRGMDEYIGEATNIHYDAAQRAIVTDLVFHLATQASRDTFAAIKHRQNNGHPAFVSIEMETTDVPGSRGMEATNIAITGWIATDTPACRRCAVPKQQTAAPEENKGEKRMTDSNTDNKAAETAQAPTVEEHKALAARVTALETSIKALQDQSAADAEAKKALAAKLDAATAAAETAEKRLKALEAKPQHQAPLAASAPEVEPIADYRSEYRF
ncbi:MAG TPA: hypothetical protein O0X39_01275 [Methanocorpusculum sp.]|nr:hypothetical protein [Methanocorpusculum sp.]